MNAVDRSGNMTTEWLDEFRESAIVEIDNITMDLPEDLEIKFRNVVKNELEASIGQIKQLDELLENGLLTTFDDQEYKDYKNG